MIKSQIDETSLREGKREQSLLRIILLLHFSHLLNQNDYIYEKVVLRSPTSNHSILKVYMKTHSSTIGKVSLFQVQAVGIIQSKAFKLLQELPLTLNIIFSLYVNL